MEKITIRSIIEILGGPKEHVEKALHAVEEKLTEQDYLTLLTHKVFDPVEYEKKPLWTGFVEAEFTVKSVQDIISFCFDFMPSSVEIMDPTSLVVKNKDLDNMINDLLAHMHKFDMTFKNIYAQNLLFKRKIERGELQEVKKDHQKE